VLVLEEEEESARETYEFAVGAVGREVFAFGLVLEDHSCSWKPRK
jgi:hypothetical protein